MSSLSLLASSYRVFAIGFAYIGVLLTFAFLAAFIYARRVRYTERLVAAWLIWDGLIHLTLEGAYLYFELSGTTKTSSHVLAQIWREYGRADARWNMFDVCLVPMEMWTVFLMGPLCFWIVYALKNRKPYRHFLQIILCISELYGGWITFGPEWVSGSKFLNTSDPFLLWVHLVFFNMIWVVIPLLLLWQSRTRLCFLEDLGSSIYLPGWDEDDDRVAQSHQKRS